MKRNPLLSIFAALFLATTAPASSPRDIVFHESADASLVELPVNVVGRDGLPIRGLTAADFEIEDEGHLEQISALDVIDMKHNRTSPEAPEMLPEAARRHFLFLFDLSFASPDGLVRSRRAATEFIEHEMDSQDRVAVATTSVETGPRFLINFTSDRKQLVAATRALGLPKVVDRARDPLALAFVTPGDSYTPNPSGAGADLDDGARTSLETVTTRLFANLEQKNADQFAVTRLSRHLSGMGSLAVALDSVEGTKRVVYFSEGFDGRLVFGSRSRTGEDMAAENDEMATPGFWASDIDKRYLNSPLERQITDTMELFRRSDCILYAINIARPGSNGDATLGKPVDGQESLFLFAHETGGELIQNGNDLVGALHRVDERTTVTYVLSFRPSARLGEGKFHRLKVRVREKAARVSARAGYYEARAFHALTPLERLLAAADVINGGRPKGDIPIRAIAVPLADSGIARVPIVIQIPGNRLAGSANPPKLHLGLFVYVTDAQGALADYFSRSVSFDLTRQANQLSVGEFRYSADCRLLPGRYRLRAYVRDEESGRFGFTMTAIEVPDFGDSRLHLLPPLFVGEGRGVNLRDSSQRDGGLANPFEIRGFLFAPRLAPRIPAGSDAKICLMLYRKGASATTPFAIEGRILDASGRPLGPAKISMIGKSDPLADGLSKVLLNFSPADLPPGDYNLRITIRDSRWNDAESSGEAPFSVS